MSQPTLQKRAITLAVFALAILFLFPPWTHALKKNMAGVRVAHPTGHFFILSEFQGEEDGEQYISHHVDLSRLAAECLAVLAACALAYFVLNSIARVWSNLTPTGRGNLLAFGGMGVVAIITMLAILAVLARYQSQR